MSAGFDPNTPRNAPQGPPPPGVLVFACLRNAMLRLPDFLAHHRGLGVVRFVLVDNGSDDGTGDYLAAQPDVALFATDHSYAAARCGIDWINALLDAHGRGRWCLVLDDDEQLIFPGWEATPLPALTAWLDSAGAEAMKAPMLDMYPAGPLARLDYAPGDRLIEACPWFDGAGYDRARDGLPVRGGVRRRLFWAGRGRDHDPPFLTKIPLIRWREGLRLEASTHILKGATLAPVSGLLLHFKLLQDFAARAAEEVRRGEHFAGARQYAAYDEVARSGRLVAKDPGSVRLRDSAQLVRLGLMRVPGGYPFAAPEQERT